MLPLGSSIQQDYHKLLKDSQQECLKQGLFESKIFALTFGISQFVDSKIRELVHKLEFAGVSQNFCLIALGSYGRQTMCPFSDVDLVCVYEDNLPTPEIDTIEKKFSHLVQDLWDAKFSLAQGFHSLASYASLLEAEQTAYTALLDARLIVGSSSLFAKVKHLQHNSTRWTPEVFIAEKLSEQAFRQEQQDLSLMGKLEPNIKKVTGGIRSIDIIYWIGKKLFGAESLEQLANKAEISQQEKSLLLDGYSLLLKLRFLLHCEFLRAEDRLLFSHQQVLAEQLKIESNSLTAIENLMKIFFKQTTNINNASRLIVNFWQESLLIDSNKPEDIAFTDFFKKGNSLGSHQPIEASAPRVIFQLFAIMAQYRIKKILPETERKILEIVPELQIDPKDKKAIYEYFFQILATSHPSFYVSKMAELGLLQKIIPQFSLIEGQMQYDLFHQFTVDKHSLIVLRSIEKIEDFLQHPQKVDGSVYWEYASRLMNARANRKILYLASIFHDIAKGRQGDHSILGAEDIEDFCHKTKIPAREKKILVWLIRQHLSMSITAQRKDISDPEVIKDFSTKVKNQEHLDYLYIFTIADIYSTNQSIWNQWKGNLLHQLYTATSEFFSRKTLSNQETLLKKREKSVYKQIQAQNQFSGELAAWLKAFPQSYWIQHPQDFISQHIKDFNSSREKKQHSGFVCSKQLSKRSWHLFVYKQDTTPHDLLYAATAIVSLFPLNILAAQTQLMPNFGSYVTFFIEQPSNFSSHQEILTKLKQLTVERAFCEIDLRSNRAELRTKRAQKNQLIQPIAKAEFIEDKLHLRLKALDFPMLLFSILGFFNSHKLILEQAQINTLGNSIEDSFVLGFQASERKGMDAVSFIKQLEESCVQLVRGAEV